MQEIYCLLHCSYLPHTLFTHTPKALSFLSIHASHHGTDWAITTTRRTREASVLPKKAAHCPLDPAADVAVIFRGFLWSIHGRDQAPLFRNNGASLLHNNQSIQTRKGEANVSSTVWADEYSPFQRVVGANTEPTHHNITVPYQWNFIPCLMIPYW